VNADVVPFIPIVVPEHPDVSQGGAVNAAAVPVIPTGTLPQRDAREERKRKQPEDVSPSTCPDDVSFHLNAYSQARVGMMHGTGVWADFRRALYSTSNEARSALCSWKEGNLFLGWRRWETLFTHEHADWWNHLSWRPQDWTEFVNETLNARFRLGHVTEYFQKPKETQPRSK